MTIDAYDSGAEAPELTVESAAGLEDTVFALNIDAALADTDGSETLSVTIGGVPDGASLSAGTDNQDGTWTLTSDQLEGLTLTPPADSNEDFSLMVTATSSQGTDTASTVAELMVDITGVADTPTLNAALGDPVVEAGNPQPVAYWNMNETFDSGTLADSVGGHTAETHCGLDMDDGGVFGTTAAEFNGSNDYIEAPHSDELKPDSGAITLWFNADTTSGRQALVSTDSSGYDTGGHFGLFVENGCLRLRMQGTDDQTDMTGGNVSSNAWNQVTVTWGDEGAQVYLNGQQVLADANWTRGLEGNDNPWTFGTNQWVSGDDVANNLRDYFNGHMDDIAIFDKQLSAEEVASLHTAGVNDFMNSGSGGDLVIPLEIASALTDTDGSETLSVTVSGLPEGATLSAGSVNDDGSVSLSSDQLQGLEMRIAGGDTAGFNLVVASTTTENDGDTTTSTQTLAVPAFDGSAEAPTLSGDVGDGAFDGSVTTFALDLSSELVDTDGSESLSIQIEGVPSGATLSAGTLVGAGTYVLTAGELDGLSMTLPANVTDPFDLSVVSTATEESTGDTESASLTLAVEPLATMPVSIRGSGSADDIEGGLVDDRLRGRSGDDTIRGLDGDDFIDGGSGRDQIDGGAGDDRLEGGRQDDTIAGGDGDDRIFGEDGNDILDGGAGDDTLEGGAGADVLFGRSGSDLLYGGDGDDVLYGGDDTDLLDGGRGDDMLSGGAGDEILTGGEGDDVLHGGAGADRLEGDDGADVVYGGAGDDVIIGGKGDDVILGGEGGDTFIFDAESGDDVITDIFANDTLAFEGQEFHMDDLILSENEDGDVVMSFNNVEGASVTLSGVKMEDLDTNDDGSPSDGYSVTEDDGKVTITLDGIT